MKKLLLFLLLSISLYGQKFEFLVPKNNAIVRPSQRVEINWLNQYTDSTLLSWYNFSTQTWNDLQFSTRKNFNLRIDTTFRDSILLRIRAITPMIVEIDTFLTEPEDLEQSVIDYKSPNLYVGTRARLWRNDDFNTYISPSVYSIQVISNNEVIFGSNYGVIYAKYGIDSLLEIKTLVEMSQVRGLLYIDSNNIIAGDKEGLILKFNKSGNNIDTIQYPNKNQVYKIIKRNQNTYIASYDGIIRIYDGNLAIIDSITLSSRSNSSVIWALDAIGDTIIFGGVDDTLRIYNNVTNSYINKIALDGDIRDIDIINSNQFITIGLDSIIRIFNLSGNLICSFSIPIQGLSGVIAGNDYKIVGRKGKIVTIKTICSQLEEIIKVYIIPPPEINRKIVNNLEEFRDRVFWDIYGKEIRYEHLNYNQIYITNKKEIFIYTR